MRNLPVKILVALLTFTVGVALATYWFLNYNPVVVRNLLNELLLENPKPIKKLPAPSESFLKGKSEAEQDISNGNLKVVTLGTEMLRQGNYRKILKTEYRIEVNNLGCLISDKDREFADGYNQTAEVAIEQRYGKGILKDAAQRADEEANRFFKYLEDNKEELEKKYPPKKR
jgi:hypothetical protein